MECKNGTAARNRNVFKGAVLVSLLVESHPKQFPSRTVACNFARRLFKEGLIGSIFGAKDFEDSSQLFLWHDEAISTSDSGVAVTSTPPSSNSNSHSLLEAPVKPPRQLDWQLVEDIKHKLLSRSEAYNIVTSYNAFFKELEHDFGYNRKFGSPQKSLSVGSDVGWSGGGGAHYTSTLELKKDAAYSTDSSLDAHTNFGKFRDNSKQRKKHSNHSSLSEQSQHLSSKSTPSLNVQSHEQSPHLNLQEQKRELIKQHFISPHKALSKMFTGNHVMSKEVLTSDGNLNLEPFRSSSSEPAILGYKDGAIQPEALACSQIFLTTENAGKKFTRNSETEGIEDKERTNRSPQESRNQHFKPIPPEMQKWLDSGASHFNDKQQWNLRTNGDGSQSDTMEENKARWQGNVVRDRVDSGRKWPDTTYSYSDNEKQLLEEMRRMKKEHQNVLRTYEGRINKLMAKMHELRNIAEMLEHSSNKSSPYGELPGKLTLLNILGDKVLEERKACPESASSETDQVPPPLPPRPGRGFRVYPNKPIIHTNVTMRPLPWTRILLQNNGGVEEASTVWHGMTEPKIDTDELQRLFSGSSDFPSDVNLFEDICLRRGRNQAQLVNIFDSERSQRIISELQALHCTLPEVIQVFVSLNCDGLHMDSFAELLELLTSERELHKILHHVKRKGASQLNAPEFLVCELSKVDHFIERLELLRFKNKVQINLFEINQQLRELQTACEEIMSSVPLKHVLETVLTIGNYMNAGTDRGQADGFKLDILNTLKDMQDMSKQCNLLELVMRIYCLKFESEFGFGCPTRFHLPEPSNMRHAAQVSFDDIQRAMKELKDEMSVVKKKLGSLSNKEGNTLTVALRVASDSFMTSALEVLAEEQKLLEDTRAKFWKASSYFSFDGQKSTPHEFFHIWASFLHDCKYYWKLAHRNLAKAKFNNDLAAKSQLSCSSLPGFSSLKSAMLKHIPSFQQDDKMRASKTQHLQHINSWIESVGRYTMELQMEGTGSNLENSDSQHSGSPKEHKKLHLQQKQDNQDSSSPPYQNQQQTTPQRNSSNPSIYIDKQFEKSSKSKQNKANIPSASRCNDFEAPLLYSSPKNITATPPNVIKPQPVVSSNQAISTASGSPSDLHFAKPVSRSLYKSPSETTFKSSKLCSDESFGFNQFHISPHSQNHYTHLKDAPDSNHVDSSDDPIIDSAQKNNTKLFKSLPKQDQKRYMGEEISQDSQNPEVRNMSVPFSNVKTTFVHKLSRVDNSKFNSMNSHNISDKTRENETSPKLLQCHSVDTFSPHISNMDSDIAQNGNFHNGRIKDHVNYQNICFSNQLQHSEGLNHAPTTNTLEVPKNVIGKSSYKDGHESFQSTLSSLQSGRDNPRSNYQGRIIQVQDSAANQKSAFSKNSMENILDKQSNTFHDANTNKDLEPNVQSNLTRIRAPIVLGSNMSISDAYNKESESIKTQVGTTDMNKEQCNECVKPTVSNQTTNQDKSSSSGPIRSYVKPVVSNPTVNSVYPICVPNISDPKWVRATPVPVYKAKLIPNYENQTKYDPLFEGGVRGKAEAVIPVNHAQQVAGGSGVYKDELQKKDERYIGGDVCPVSGHCQTDSLQCSGPTGISYTILPPKLKHFHASPLIMPQNPHSVSPLPENVSKHYPQSDSIAPQSIGNSQSYVTQNIRENVKQVFSRDYTPIQTNLLMESSKSHVRCSPERKVPVTRIQNTFPFRDEKNRKLTPDGFPAYRSSSAHSIIERRPRDKTRGVQSAQASPDIRHQKMPDHRSRRDVGGSKMTPTSHRDQGIEKNIVQPSVTSLIDRFEKGPGMNKGDIFLLDISDKPPSMTSTPVVRRKQGTSPVQPVHGELSHGRAEDDSSRAYLGGSRTQSQVETINMPGWQKGEVIGNKSGSKMSNDYHYSDSRHQTAITGYPNYHEQEQSKTFITPHSKNQQRRKQEMPEAQQTNQQSNQQKGQNNFIMFPEKQSKQQSDYNHSTSIKLNSHIQPTNNSPDRDQNSIPRENDYGFTSRSRDQANEQLVHDQNKNSPQNSKFYSLYSSPPSTQPQYSTHDLANTRQHLDQQQRNLGSFSTDCMLSAQQKASSSNDSHHLQQQQRQSPQVAYASPFNLQTYRPYNTAHASSSSNTAMPVTADSVKYSDDVYHSSKSSSLASDYPIKSAAKYGRQPGAMAVVKPTVMNI